MLLVGALLAAVAGLVLLLGHSLYCSPHEGGSGCGFTFGLVIPFVLALGLAVAGISVLARRD